MEKAWPEFLSKFNDALSRPQSTWSRTDALELWETLAAGPVGERLYRWIRRLVRDPSAARDIFQECFAKLPFQRTYDPKGKGASEFRKWVQGCIVNHIYAHWRRFNLESERFAPIGPREENISGADGRRTADQIGRQIDFEAALRSLDQRSRDCISRKLKGQSDQEIASAHSTTVKNIRVIRHRAVEVLKKRLAV